jgi:myo-inositol 2-dehydrogenase/D-chiro-inositol 1-dehydrogenase
MRIALIGTGRMGAFHARQLAQIVGPGELVISDLDASRAQAVASELRITAAGLEEAIASAEALVIVTSSAAHPDLVRAGLERLMPTFCEKPLALDLAETRRLVEEIEASGIPFQFGFQRRFDPAYLGARRRLVSGELGTVYLVRMVANDHAPPPENYVRTSGGIFRDSSVHDFDVMRWLTDDEVETVYAEGSALGFEMLARHGDVGTVAVVLRTRGGVLGVIGGGRHNPPGYDVRVEVVGSRDSVAIGLTDRTPIRPLDAFVPEMRTGWDSFLDRFEEAYRNEMRAFTRVAAGAEAPACTARDGLEAMRVAEAAARSMAERRPVRLDEIPA